MSRVWICEEVTAEHPLFLEEERLNLYSFEELCCYLYQNTGVLEESFFHEKLCLWLEQEVGRQELSEKLRQGIGQERSGCWCMEQILKDGGFYLRRILPSSPEYSDRDRRYLSCSDGGSSVSSRLSIFASRLPGFCIHNSKQGSPSNKIRRFFLA